MSIEEITDNIISVENYISTKFPGGWDNIRSLHLKGLRSAAIPIYMSLSKFFNKRWLFVIQYQNYSLIYTYFIRYSFCKWCKKTSFEDKKTKSYISRRWINNYWKKSYSLPRWDCENSQEIILNLLN